MTDVELSQRSSESQGASDQDSDFEAEPKAARSDLPRGDELDLGSQVRIMVALASAYAAAISGQGGKEQLGAEFLKAKTRLKSVYDIDLPISEHLLCSPPSSPDKKRGSPEQVGGGARHALKTMKSTDAMMEELAGSNESQEEQFFTIRNQPRNIKGTMRPYQVEGLNWMYQLYRCGAGGILADEMGLGKTLQTISLIAHNHLHNPSGRPVLVIVPRTTLENWENEFHMWCPDLTVLKFWGKTQRHRDALWNVCMDGSSDYAHYEALADDADVNMTEIQAAAERTIAECIPQWARPYTAASKAKQAPVHVIVTSFEIMMREKTRIKKIKYDSVIMDEAHRMKNDESLLSVEVRGIKSDYRLLITGTPLQNSLKELWSLLNFLMPELFESSESLASLFNPETFSAKDSDIQGLDALHNVLRPFMLRRLKVDVAKELPAKRELYVMLPMTPLQRRLYCGFLTKNVDILAINKTKDASNNKLLNILMELRKTTNHPYLFDGVEEKEHGLDANLDHNEKKLQLHANDHLVNVSSKLAFLDKLLPKLKKKGSRVLLFSQMTRMLDIIDDYLVWQGYSYQRIDGATDPPLRQQRIDEFNRPGSENFIFILSTRAGGLGINLATADTVIIFDSDFNPQMDLQAQDRAHRLGQKKPVTVYRLITKNSVEQRICERAAKKLQLDSLIVQQGLTAKATGKALKGSDVKDLVLFGSTAIFSADDTEGAEMTDGDVDKLLHEAEANEKERGENMKKVEEEFNLQNLQMDGGLNLAAHRNETKEEAAVIEKECLQAIHSAADQEIELEKLNRRQRRALESGLNLDGSHRDHGHHGHTKKRPKKPVLKTWRRLANGGHPHMLYSEAAVERLDDIDGELRAYEDYVWNAEHPESESPPRSNSTEGSSGEEALPGGPPHSPETHEALGEERDELIEQGFTNWSKSEFDRLKKALTLWRPHQVNKIAEIVQSKENHEIRSYLKAADEDKAFKGLKYSLDKGRDLHTLLNDRLKERKFLKDLLKEFTSDSLDRPSHVDHTSAIEALRTKVFGNLDKDAREKYDQGLLLGEGDTSQIQYLTDRYGIKNSFEDEEALDNLRTATQWFDSCMMYCTSYAIQFCEEIEKRPPTAAATFPSPSMQPSPGSGSRQWIKGIGWVRDGKIGYNSKFANSKTAVAEQPRYNVPEAYQYREAVASVEPGLLHRLLMFVNLFPAAASRYPSRCINNTRVDFEEEALPRLTTVVNWLCRGIVRETLVDRPNDELEKKRATAAKAKQKVKAEKSREAKARARAKAKATKKDAKPAAEPKAEGAAKPKASKKRVLPAHEDGPKPKAKVPKRSSPRRVVAATVSNPDLSMEEGPNDTKKKDTTKDVVFKNDTTHAKERMSSEEEPKKGGLMKWLKPKVN